MAAIGIVQQAIPASFGNNVDFTISGFGTPSAAFFIMSGTTANGTITADARWGQGALDGTTMYNSASRALDANAGSGVARQAMTDGALGTIQDTNTRDGRTVFDGWITDGVTLDNAQAYASGISYMCTAVLFSGDCQAKLINHNLGTGTSAQNITTVGFQPDIVFIFGDGGATGGGISSFYVPTFGVATYDGATITQRSMLWRNRASVATTEIASYVSDTKSGGSLSSTSNSIFYSLTLSDFDADGFSITQSASSSSDVISLLCIKLPAGHQAKLFDVTVPTSGNLAVTAPGFLPYFGLMSLLAGPTALNSIDTSNGVVSSLAVLDDTNLYATSVSSKDGVTTTIEKSYVDNAFKLLRASDGTVETTASGYAFDSAGWDITLTANPAAAVLGWGLAIGAGAAGLSVNEIMAMRRRPNTPLIAM